MSRRDLLKTYGGDVAYVPSGPPYSFAFGQADGTLLEAISPLAISSGGASDLTVQGGVLAQTGTAGGTGRQWWTPPLLPSADAYIQGTWKTATNRTTNWLAARITDGTHFVGVRRNANVFQVQDINGGTVTTLGSYAAALNDVVRLETQTFAAGVGPNATGGPLPYARLLVNGVERVPWTAFTATLTTARFGVLLALATAVVNPWLDDLGIGTLA